MEVVIVADPGEGGRLAAEPIARGVAADPAFVLGVATGSSPLPIYRALEARVAAGLDMSQVRIFALDEYVGLPRFHPASYHQVIRNEVAIPLGIDRRNVHVPDGLAVDQRSACDEFEAAIRDAGGVGIQILGIGCDGHIGFNEPSSSLASRTRIKTLAPGTRRDNARFFEGAGDIPTHCVTQGLGTILEARHLILVAFGTQKAAAVAAAVEGPVSAICPASVIQLHPHVSVIVDEAAAASLTLTDYYRSTYAAKPEWQSL